MPRSGKPLNNTVLLAHSGSETGGVAHGAITNQIVIKGPSDSKASTGSDEGKIIDFTRDGAEYQFKLRPFEQLLDQLLPHLASPIDKITGEVDQTYQQVKSAIDQIRTHAPESYPLLVALVKHKYGHVAPSVAHNSLYSYFMGCAKTGELGVCSLNCAGSIAHDHKHECGDVVFVHEATGQLRAINKLKEGPHVYIYVDPNTFSEFTEKHVKSLKALKIEHVTVLTKCDSNSESFQQQKYPIDELGGHQCPCKGGGKPKPDHGDDHGHDHGHDNDHNKGKDKSGPGMWMAIVTIILAVIIIILLCVCCWYMYQSTCEIEKAVVLEQERVAILRDIRALASNGGPVNITIATE